MERNQKPAEPKGMPDVLSSAQDATRRKLIEAIGKKQDTGQSLADILRKDVDPAMFKSIWSFLNTPIGQASGKKNGVEKSDRKVKDVLVEQGLVSAQDWEALQDGSTYDPETGRALVAGGLVTEAQLQEALAIQERSGQSVWRVLVNRGVVTPKQIADARKYGSRQAIASLDGKAVSDMLLRTSLVNEQQLQAAFDEHKRTGQDVFQTLVDSGVVAKQRLGEALAVEFGVPFVDLRHTKIDPSAAGMLPEPLALQHRMIPLAVVEGRVRLAMANPKDMAARELFQRMVSKEVEPVLAFEKDILDGIRQMAAAMPDMTVKESPLDRIRARLKAPTGRDANIGAMAQNLGAVNLVAAILEGAINSRATDVHIESQSFGLRVRYRIDGLLYDIMTLPEQVMNEVISRVKVLAGMDITERRHPQDGRFTIQVSGKPFDLRVATMPTAMGEKIVLRLLNPEDVFLGLQQLGLEPEQLTVLQEAIAQPHGMVLVTGPIGSGKTTTIYSVLSEIDIFTRNVVTIEDPVEYLLPGINQVQVDAKQDLTFANLLRSVVRQDANVMMVGEIRDEDTAHVAVRSAMTGHQVFSTLHANDAVGAIDTLLHLKIQPFLITSALIAVVAQRLVRRVCPMCKETYTPSPTLMRAVGLSPETDGDVKFVRARGCQNCFETGYKGRTGIFEVFRLDETARAHILAGARHDELNHLARNAGMATLMECGLKKARAGMITPEELLRVTSI